MVEYDFDEANECGGGGEEDTEDTEDTEENVLMYVERHRQHHHNNGHQLYHKTSQKQSNRHNKPQQAMIKYKKADQAIYMGNQQLGSGGGGYFVESYGSKNASSKQARLYNNAHYFGSAKKASIKYKEVNF
jgi:hypothetical protein